MNTKIKNNILIKIIKDCQKNYPDIKIFLEQLLELSLEYLVQKEDLKYPIEISISIINEKSMKKINKKYRNKNQATDVLSFSQIEGEEFPEINQFLILGDILICYQVALKQSKENQTNFYSEIMRLVVHGLYHLLGYDHEKSKEEEKIMFSKEKKLLNFLKKKKNIKKWIDMPIH